jgi:hypothetical protein
MDWEDRSEQQESLWVGVSTPSRRSNEEQKRLCCRNPMSCVACPTMDGRREEVEGNDVEGL